MSENNIFFGPEQSSAILDLLQSIFIAEIICPSPNLSFFFGWMSDVEVINNEASEFSSLESEWPNSMVRLSDVLKALLKRGCKISIVLKDVDHNRKVEKEIRKRCQEFTDLLKIYWDEKEHKKVIVGEDFVLEGSMNLTKNGLNINGESITFNTNLHDVSIWQQEVSSNLGDLTK